MSWLSGMADSLASTMASQVNSYIMTGSAMTSPTRTNPLQYVNYEAYYKFLETYHFAIALVNVFTSSLTEVIESQELTLVCDDKNQKAKIDEVNEFISDLNIKGQILNDLFDWVYRGGYFYSLDMDEKKMYPTINFDKFQVIKEGTNVVGYLYGGKVFKVGDAVAYWYTKDTSIGITKAQVKKSKKYKELYDPNSLDKIAYQIKITKNNIKGIFKDQLQKIYQCYVMEFIQFFLGLRESVKPYILSMNFQGQRSDINQAAQASDRIEALLNQPANFLSSVMDPLAFSNAVSYTLFNNIKVVPNVDHFSNLGELQSGDFTNIRDRAARELDNGKKEVLNNLGIPEELFNGNSNRWEVVSRSDRFATVLNQHLSRISDFVKMVGMSYIVSQGWNISYDDLKLNLSTASFTSALQNRTKLTTLNDRLTEVQRLLQTVMDLGNNKLISVDKLQEFMLSQVGNMDSEIGSILNLDMLKEVLKKSESETGMGRPPGGYEGDFGGGDRRW